MRKLIDLTGKVFGRLTVMDRAENDGSQTCWNVLCTCGVNKSVRGTHLKSKSVVSCGCYKYGLKTTHGMSGTRQNRIWAGMLSRCRDEGRDEYKHYGGRGISVCDKWQTFEGFWDDMGPTYKKHLTIDRYPNNDGNYEPSNCRWATKTEQARNTTKNRMVELDGAIMTIAEAAERTGINKFALRQRVAAGVTGEALFAKRLASGRKKRGETQRPILEKRYER